MLVEALVRRVKSGSNGGGGGDDDADSCVGARSGAAAAAAAVSPPSAASADGCTDSSCSGGRDGDVLPREVSSTEGLAIVNVRDLCIVCAMLCMFEGFDGGRIGGFPRQAEGTARCRGARRDAL